MEARQGLEGRNWQVAIIGGGQAGLSLSYLLKKSHVDHVVLEKDRLGESWRSQRWDSFCLVTPNWQCQLPDHPYSGNDPHGFMVRDDIVRYLESYAQRFAPPLHEGVTVERVTSVSDRCFRIETSEGTGFASQVVVATGGYHRPITPACAANVPPGVLQLHSSKYRNPESLPAGAAFVVGTGQSGCQIAEDLFLSKRTVHLCVGTAPRTARRYRGKDVVLWLHEMGHYDKPVDEHPLKERVRENTNHYVTGRDGGRDIDLRDFARLGMHLYGRLLDVQQNQVTCGNDLEKNLDNADRVAENIKDQIDRFIEARGIDAPAEDRYTPVWRPAPSPGKFNLLREKITTIIWCLGFEVDYRWLQVPVFNEMGNPRHQRGVADYPGVYFLGLPWLYTWGSARFSGIARDAAYLHDRILDRVLGAPVNGRHHYENASLPIGRDGICSDARDPGQISRPN